MPSITGSDITQAASSLSAVAGILAGFGFAVLVFLVERLSPQDRAGTADDATLRALVLLGITFLGNVLVSYFWAVIAGEANIESNRPNVLSFVAGYNFALLTPLTIEAMVFMVASTHAPRVVTLFRRIYFFTVIVTLSFQWSSTISLLRTQTRDLSVFQQYGGFLSVFFPLTVILVMAGALVSQRAADNRWGFDSENSFSRFVWLLLIMLVSTAISFGVLSISGPDVALPIPVIAAAQVVWAVLVAWASMILPSEAPASG